MIQQYQGIIRRGNEDTLRTITRICSTIHSSVGYDYRWNNSSAFMNVLGLDRPPPGIFDTGMVSCSHVAKAIHDFIGQTLPELQPQILRVEGIYSPDRNGTYPLLDIRFHPYDPDEMRFHIIVSAVLEKRLVLDPIILPEPVLEKEYLSRAFSNPDQLRMEVYR